MKDNLHKLTVLEALSGLRGGEFTVVDLVSACLLRIDSVDETVKAMVTITSDNAMEKAHRLDALLAEQGDEVFDLYPLFGIPYIAKDNYSTKDVLTTASSKVLDNYYPPFDATVISRLNDAGAVLLGKANMDAFAHGSTNETSDYFPTKNPWDLTKVPGGSSGGSATAVAGDMCMFAIGSETAGSIRGPASWCGVVGVKPSYGRVSRYGVVAMASSTDSPGPLTKDISDAALVLSVMAGKDPLDATSSPVSVPDYLTELKGYDLTGVKIGKPKSYFEIELEEGVKEKVEEAIKVFEGLGAEIVELDLLDPKYSIAVYTILQRSEVSSNLSRLTGVRYGNDRSEFGKEAKNRIMLGTYTLSSGYYDAYYANAQRVRTLLVEDFNKAFEKVDLLIAPSMPCVAMSFGESEKSPMFGELMDVLNEASSIAGICGTSVPCGVHNNLPVGVQLMGKMNDEASVFGAFARYQDATKFHLERPNL